MAEPADPGFADTAECAAALGAMSDADLLRVKRFAQHRAAGLVDVDWEDLFHDALDRSLAGRRRWPRDLPFVVFLQQTIRSLAHDHWRRRLEGPVVTEADLDTRQAAAHGAAVDPSSQTPEGEFAARDLLRAVFNLFKDEPLVLSILDGLAEGLSPREIMTAVNCTPVAFASARRKIRRTLDRALAEGRLPNADF